VLKSDLCAKLNLPHVGLTTAGDCVVDARNQTRSARSAVNAARVRCAGNPQWSVVEHIEDLELKLSCDSLANTNILEQRDISEIVRRTIKAVATNVSNGPKVNGIIEVAGPEQFRLNEFVLQARLAKLGFSFLTHRTEERLRKSNLKSAKLVICVAWLVPG
jgi:hypothetical protein